MRDDDDDPDFPDPSDVVDDDSLDTEPCPNCGKAIYADAEYCPRCGHYISAEEKAPGRQPLWIIVVAAVCIVVVVLLFIR